MEPSKDPVIRILLMMQLAIMVAIMQWGTIGTATSNERVIDVCFDAIAALFS